MNIYRIDKNDGFITSLLSSDNLPVDSYQDDDTYVFVCIDNPYDIRKLDCRNIEAVKDKDRTYVWESIYLDEVQYDLLSDTEKKRKDVLFLVKREEGEI